VNVALAEALPIEPFHGGQGWDVRAFMFGHEKLVYAGPLANEAAIMVWRVSLFQSPIVDA
jgi:hypothetical protein